MGSLISPELCLASGFSPEPGVRDTMGELLAQVSKIHSPSEKILKLDDCVNRLQEEMKKIEAFKRELPLCVLLLSHAIATMKEELAQCKKSNAEPVLEEFMPLKKSCTEEKDGVKVKDISSRDKLNWLSSVQLWNSNDGHRSANSDFSNNGLSLKLDNDEKRTEETINWSVMCDLFQSGKKRAEIRAFVPFKGRTDCPVVAKEDIDELPGPGLSLCTPGIENSREEISSIGSSPKSCRSRSVSSSATTNVQSNIKAGQQQAARKQRRCWSPELHRQFISALQQLGGPQAATPKQIRELIQVDGLTNDEVKSHLQKYRLHTRRVTANTTQPSGLWMSREQYGESLKQSNSQSGSPQGPLQLVISSRGTSGGHDGIEDEDDEKSESHSWKSHFPLCG